MLSLSDCTTSQIAVVDSTQLSIVKACRLFDAISREVLFQQDVQFNEHYPLIDSLAPASPSLHTLSSLENSLPCDDEDANDVPIQHPPPPSPLPKWAYSIVDAVGDWAGDPQDSCHTHSQICRVSLASKATLANPLKILDVASIPK